MGWNLKHHPGVIFSKHHIQVWDGMSHVTDWLSTFLHAAGLGHRSCSFAQLRIYHLIVDRLHAVGLRHLFVFDHCQSSGWQRFSESPSLNNRRSCSQYLCIFIYLYNFYNFICLSFHMVIFSYVYLLPFNSRRSCSQSKGGHCPLHRPGESFFLLSYEKWSSHCDFKTTLKSMEKYFEK